MATPSKYLSKAVNRTNQIPIREIEHFFFSITYRIVISAMVQYPGWFVDVHIYPILLWEHTLNKQKIWC